MFRKFVSLVVSGYMITSCATREVTFISEPPGAIVKFGEKEQRTPCVLTIPDEQQAVVILPESGEFKKVEVPGAIGFLDRTGSILGKGGAYILYGISVPLIVVGAFGAAWLSSMNQEDSRTYSGDQDDTYGLVLLIATGGGLLLGMPLYAAAEYLDKVSDLEEPVVWVVFPSAFSKEEDSIKKPETPSGAIEDR